ncbi:MAG: GNAT family N-acetyltransferase [Candidatus Bathyarchaeota archaeon]|nr:GNAT family N-acetyltransferase [Candidatus Bathyarchaeota archaeon]
MTLEESKLIEVSIYKPEHKSLWDEFVSVSKNGVFLFYRDYMEYHSDRFRDHSLLFFKKGKLIGLLPANVTDGVLYSHAGLTFGGVISGYDMRTQIMLAIFEKLVQHCKEENIIEIVYKAIPYIYHSIPADEDLYALFRFKAKLFGRNVTSSIYGPSKLKFDESRIRAIKKAKKNNLIVKRSYDFKKYMNIVEDVLKERYGVKPVHTPEEIELLARRFPDNIKLFSSFKNDAMLAGVMIYESKNVAHAQYIANSTEGRDLGALEIIFDYLINDCYKASKYFDFGISTEQAGQVLNTGLIAHKEGFGARAVMHDFYQLTLKNST